jgi:DNA-binding CsgD family transcriptional regulator
MTQVEMQDDLVAAGRFEEAFRRATEVADQNREAARSWAEAGLYAAIAGRRGESARAMQRSRAALHALEPGASEALEARAYLAIATIVLGHDARARSAVAGLRAAARNADPGFAAFVEAIRAFRATTSPRPEHEALPLEDALERLDAAGRGSDARLLRAMPVRPPQRGGVDSLSEAEKRVLLLAANGATSKEIAAELDRSSQTVDVHIRSICRKLGCSGRRQAVALAIREGLIAERRSH